MGEEEGPCEARRQRKCELSARSLLMPGAGMLGTAQG